MKQKLKGFTLIELIVVIAIIAVLAAILIPQIMGYVRKSKLEVANNNAQEIFNQASIYIHDPENLSKDYSTITLISSSDSTSGDTLKEAFCENMDKVLSANILGSWKVFFKSDGTVEAAFYSKKATDPYVGSWPKTKNEITSGGLDSITTYP